MSFVGDPFLHDIFVSYSHGASRVDGTAYLTDWTREFVRTLEKELRSSREMRDTLNIFHDLDRRVDRSVDPMGPLADGLRESVQHAALLMVLMSRDYQEPPASVWCKRERDWWAEAQREPNLATPEGVPLGIGPKERIPIVRMHDTSAEWPELFVDSEKAQLVGFDFRDRDVVPLQQPLGWGLSGPEFERAVRPAMTALLVRVVQRLNTIRERAQAWREAQEEIRRLAQPTGLTMYLHARRDQAAEWERKVEELMGCGYSVVPADLDDEPRDLDRQQELRELRVQTLTGCNALLLLGAGEGRKLDRDMVLIGKEDRDSTRALRRNKVLPWGVLDLTGPPLANPLRRSTARLLQGRWLDGTRPEWCSDLQSWLAELAAQMEQKA